MATMWGSGVFPPRASGGSRSAQHSTLSWGWGHSRRPWASLMSPCPSPQEIAECCRAIQTEAMALNPGLGPLLVLPLHPGVGRAAQKVYEAPEESSRERRVIVTHWLADSSFSLGTVHFVIDSGLELRNVSVPACARGAGTGSQAVVSRGASSALGHSQQRGLRRDWGLHRLLSSGSAMMPQAGGRCVGRGICPREVAVTALHWQGGGTLGEGWVSSAGVPSHGLTCRSTTPAFGQSPRCCGPSARARQSHACSEPQAAPKVRAPALVSPKMCLQWERAVVPPRWGSRQPVTQHASLPACTCCPLPGLHPSHHCGSQLLSCRDLPTPLLGGLLRAAPAPKPRAPRQRDQPQPPRAAAEAPGHCRHGPVRLPRPAR